MTSAKNKNRRLTKTAVISFIIVMMLILPEPASAVIVSIDGLSGSITQGSSKIFNITVTMENPDKFVPISNVTLNIDNESTTEQWTFNPVNGTIISGNSDISVNVTLPPNSSYFGHGYGYGVDTNGSGYGYDFGYGSGYGYNYGQGNGTVSFSYQVTLSTTNLTAGSYTATAYLNTGSSIKPYFASTSVSFTVSAATPTQAPSGGSSSGSSSSGGGGVVSSEPFDNIAKSERFDKDLTMNSPVTFTFTAPELGIYEIAITGKENENDVVLRVEELKGVSRIVALSPPGTVYKNINIWISTERFEKALVRFRVENSWLESNNFAGKDIKLARWDGSRWMQLETTEKTKDNTYTYFEAETASFSPYVITGLKGEAMSTATPAAEITQSEVTATNSAETPAPGVTKKTTPGFGAAMAVFVTALLVAIWNRRKRG